MKNLLSHTLCCLFLLVGLAACIEDDLGQKGGSLSSDGEVTLKFSTAIPGLETVNTRSIDPDGEPIKMMWLFLFDENGYYLGHVKADALTYTAGSATTTAHGTFTATVTSSDARGKSKPPEPLLPRTHECPVSLPVIRQHLEGALTVEPA